MSNSLDDIKRRLQQGSVAEGWGAIMVLGRERLNRLLEQEFIASFADNSYLPLVSGEVALDDAGQERAVLRDVQLGPPLLMFHSASLRDSSARLRMPLLAGHYMALHRSHSVPQTLTAAFDISQAQGFFLEVEINLAMVVGSVDLLGEVTVDLSRGSAFKCNLAGDDPSLQARLGTLFRQQLQGLPAGRGVFRLGVLDLKHYGMLAPKEFFIRTQAAPGARVPGALNWGDGAVVLLIALQAPDSKGVLPPGSQFPYLIPSDRNPDGSERFSAALLVGAPMRRYLQAETPRLFENLSFPGGNTFEPLAGEAAHDLVSFGRIGPAPGRLHLEPAMAVIKAGSSQSFTLLDAADQPVSGATWRAVSLDSRTLAGHGSISNGRYTAPSRAAIGHPSLSVMITASVGSGAEQRQASALLRVVFDSMAIAPRMAVHPLQPLPSGQSGQAPIRLSAATLERLPDWNLRGETYGELAQSGEHDALFVPAPELGRKSIVAQRLEARGDQTQPASLLLPAGQQLLGLEPFAVSAARRSSHVQLRDDPTLLPGLERRWSVIGGDGTVDAHGAFSAPAEGITADSVVLCEIVHNEVVFSSGYSVIGLSELEQEPDWKELSLFTLKTTGFPGTGNATLYGNGYQQLKVEIRVETVPVGDRPPTLNQREIASIRLRELNSNQDVPFVQSSLGMADDDPALWRTNRSQNRFQLATAGQQPAQAPAADASVLELFLHSRAADGAEVKFVAVFQQDKTNRWFQSDDKGESNGTIAVISQPSPRIEYTLQRNRVDGGAPSGDAPPGDEFDYHLRTVDYWVLEGKTPMGTAVAFQTLRFVDENGRDDAGKVNESTVRWESEALREEMFSWTGYAFKDPRGETDYPDTGYIQFDDDLGNLVKAGSEANDERQMRIAVKPGYPAPGTLVISLHRSDRVLYVPASSSSHSTAASLIRDRLDKGVRVILRDQFGNLHRRLIEFDPRGGEIGHRNRLSQTGF